MEKNLCALVSRFFDHLAEASFEFGEMPEYGDFVEMCKNFTDDVAELDLAVAMDSKVIDLAKAILK